MKIVHSYVQYNTTITEMGTGQRDRYLCGACDLEYLHGARDDVLNGLLADATEEHRGDLPQRTLRRQGGLAGTPATGRQVGLLLLRLGHSCHALRGQRGGHHSRQLQMMSDRFKQRQIDLNDTQLAVCGQVSSCNDLDSAF